MNRQKQFTTTLIQGFINEVATIHNSNLMRITRVNYYLKTIQNEIQKINALEGGEGRER